MVATLARRLPFFYGWIIVSVVFVTMAFGVNARTSFSLLFPPLLDEFGWDRGVTAGAFSFGMLVSAVIGPLLGRLMDRNLAAEMWDRYQRGESKAFTKRLYTPAGQKAFDEVARKYRADRAFKQTVDRYITEFERLLDEVAREDRGPQALRNHLTSETGLVYTLLAHAAGRLG